MNLAKSAAAAVLLVGGVASVAYFSSRPPKPQPTPVIAPELNPLPVPAAKVEQSFPCRIVPQQTVLASTPATGPIEAVYADVGQTVTDGQILARVKSGTETPLIAGMEKDASQDHVREIAARLTAARAEARRLQAEAARARATLARNEPLFRKQELLNNAGATPRLVFENARAEHERDVQDLAAAEEASRQADNLVSRTADDQREAEQVAREKARTAVAVASGVATAEIHAPAAGVIIERKIAAGGDVTEANRTELFRIAIHPELLRAEFDPGVSLKPGQSISIHAGGVQIRAVMSETGADFESHLGSVTMGTRCSASVQIK